MDIIRLPIINGITPDLLNGTERYAYGLSDFTDSWELKDWQEHGGYQGSVLYLYDLQESKVYIPFKKKKNVIYQMPLYCDDMIYFLQVDYDDKKVNLYRLSPKTAIEKITDLSIDEVNLYNIRLIGEGVHITSQDESFICYYPEAFEIKLEINESVICIYDEKIYISAWIEEGVENDEITKDYSYYEKIRVKDKAGNLISEEIGSLTQFPDGKWRIS
ncbi:hypothetical protein B9N57_07010 [Finegoldia magna]|uniref:hypothetical protein n=1 Tax=Finegoldia magna TaxID=1260 RepID=UPI000B918EEF|nr:hypothetical protein [Finegoldia magna]OXZ29994.1 hypothetical protein B9N57_07010 [Finegoldia magna]